MSQENYFKEKFQECITNGGHKMIVWRTQLNMPLVYICEHCNWHKQPYNELSTRDAAVHQKASLYFQITEKRSPEDDEWIDEVDIDDDDDYYDDDDDDDDDFFDAIDDYYGEDLEVDIEEDDDYYDDDYDDDDDYPEEEDEDY